MSIKFKGYECGLVFGAYQNGRTAIQLKDAEDGSPVATATVNIVEVSDVEFKEAAVRFGCQTHQLLFIKNYSENDGMVDALVSHDIVKDTGEMVPTGFVYANVCILK